LDIGKVVSGILGQVFCCAVEGEVDNRMRGRRYERIVVEVKDPRGRMCPFFEEDGRIDHRFGIDVVTKWLELERVAVKEALDISTQINIVRIYVASPLRENEAETEVVATHGGVVSAVVRFQVEAPKLIRNKVPSIAFIVDNNFVPRRSERAPRVEAFLDVIRNPTPVVPKLYDDTRDMRVGYLRRALGYVGLLDYRSHER
jgi:hypothetical protein